ncbi:hypothetical protein ZIOFF_024569 [Zingiber officinale]|uniref:NAD(P)-binding domain-containing protein n=1 Tax=Zingiber officinale TaxID=94328 RepID=A0A8J5H8Q2_ZINOF|nr:hypothetical protein ZIOFF_024569 [Zingiber officinale]
MVALACERSQCPEEQEEEGESGGGDESEELPASNSAGIGEGQGQLVVASLLSRNIKTRLLLRDPSKAISLFGLQDENTLEGVTHIICCTGTTAFPSKRWDGDNTPERVGLKFVMQSKRQDWEGIRNLVLALPPTLERLVLVSSIGVTKYNVLPWSIMNLFGVLKFKKMGEDFVRSSVVPFTIISNYTLSRAGRLTDGPYTSYDLNTLLKATAGKRRAVILSQGTQMHFQRKQNIDFRILL